MEGWGWIGLLLVVALIAGLGYMAWQRRNAGGAATGALGRKDKFAPAAALSPTEMELLNYLVRAFPGRAVLFRVALSHLVSVRRADNRVALQQRLGEHSVDYVVCDRDGRAVYAFELDALHDTPAEAEEDAREKHLVLKSAGIRLIRLNRSTRDMPDPQSFRSHLRTAELTPDGSPATVTAPGALTPVEDERPAARPPSRPKAPRLGDGPIPGQAGGFRDTEPMTMTGLMSLDPTTEEEADAAAQAWGVTRPSRSASG